MSVMEADVLAIYFSDWPDDKKQKLHAEWFERIGHYAYRGRGRVIDQTEGLIEVQGFISEIDVLNEAF